MIDMEGRKTLLLMREGKAHLCEDIQSRGEA